MESPPSAPLRQADVFVQPPIDPATIVLGKAEERALCSAFKNRVPGYPTLCPNALAPPK